MSPSSSCAVNKPGARATSTPPGVGQSRPVHVQKRGVAACYLRLAGNRPRFPHRSPFLDRRTRHVAAGGDPLVDWGRGEAEHSLKRRPELRTLLDLAGSRSGGIQKGAQSGAAWTHDDNGWRLPSPDGQAASPHRRSEPIAPTPPIFLQLDHARIVSSPCGIGHRGENDE